MFQYVETHLLILGFKVSFFGNVVLAYYKMCGFLVRRLSFLPESKHCFWRGHTCVPASLAAGGCRVDAKKGHSLCRCWAVNQVLQVQVAKALGIPGSGGACLSVLWHYRVLVKAVLKQSSCRHSVFARWLPECCAVRKTVGGDQPCSCWSGSQSTEKM